MSSPPDPDQSTPHPICEKCKKPIKGKQYPHEDADDGIYHEKCGKEEAERAPAGGFEEVYPNLELSEKERKEVLIRSWEV